MHKLNKCRIQLLRFPLLMLTSMSILGCALSPYEHCALVYDNREEISPSQSDAGTAAAMVAAAYMWGTFMPECKRGQRNLPNNIERLQNACSENKCLRNEE